MACPDDNQIVAYLQRLLAPAEAMRIEDHIDACAPCRFLVSTVARSAAPAREDDVIQPDDPAASSSARTLRPPPAAALHTARRSDAFVGTTLGQRYKVKGLLGRGGMGAVYEAVHIGLGKQVAIKTLSTAIADNDRAHRRFLLEARAVSKLSHPHIIEVSDFGTSDDGLPYLVMECLHGEDLGQTLRREKTLTIGRLVPIFHKVAAAVQVAHDHGIIHRDLKPQNIFLCRFDGIADFPKVLDFGVSKVLDATDALTGTDSRIGTPNYMAPEQADGRSKEVDQRSDVFALGAILYRCLAGVNAFKGSPVSVFYRIIHEQPTPLHEVNPKIPRAVATVVHRALSKRPAARFQSVAELSEALGDATGVRSTSSAGHEEAARASKTPSSTHGPSATTRRSPARWLLLLSLPALAAGVLVVHFTDLSPAKPQTPIVRSVSHPPAALPPPAVEASSRSLDAASPRVPAAVAPAAVAPAAVAPAAVAPAAVAPTTKAVVPVRPKIIKSRRRTHRRPISIRVDAGAVPSKDAAATSKPPEEKDVIY